MRKFKHGDVVSVRSEHDGSRTLCVALYVDVQKNPTFIAGNRSGVYLLRGQWYGNSHTNLRSFGKCEGTQDEYNVHAYKVGTIHSYKNHKFD